MGCSTTFQYATTTNMELDVSAAMGGTTTTDNPATTDIFPAAVGDAVTAKHSAAMEHAAADVASTTMGDATTTNGSTTMGSPTTTPRNATTTNNTAVNTYDRSATMGDATTTNGSTTMGSPTTTTRNATTANSPTTTCTITIRGSAAMGCSTTDPYCATRLHRIESGTSF
jgi:hypothetical protein